MFQTNTSVHNPDKRLEITARSWGARNSVCFALTRDITSLSLCVHVLSHQVKETTCKRSESEVLSIVSAKQNKEKKKYTQKEIRCHNNKRHDKRRKNKTKQAKTRHDKTRQDKTRQAKTRQDKT